MPNMPKYCLSSDGYAPKPISVAVQGRPVSLTNSVSSSAALPKTTPPPKYTKGRFAAASICTAFLI